MRPLSPVWWLRGFGITLLVVALAALAPGTSYARGCTRLTCDPAQPCRLSAGGYEVLLEGTKLEGLGRTLEAGEKLYQVNGLFVAAVAAHESGWGESHLAREQNNLGGIKGAEGYRDFDTREICVLYMFSLFDRRYISRGRESVSDIGALYCGTDGWAESVEDILKNFVQSARETMD
jgi:hypothetical protein